tara:strand:- start:2474 stop:2644 length:171 start_codon:yes stop_codon:yes gene_type:complete
MTKQEILETLEINIAEHKRTLEKLKDLPDSDELKRKPQHDLKLWEAFKRMVESLED